MSDTKTKMTEDIQLSSTVFPTESDAALWEKLSPGDRRKIVSNGLDAAEISGLAPGELSEDRLRRIRSKR